MVDGSQTRAAPSAFLPNLSLFLNFHGAMRWPPWSSNSKDDISKPKIPLPDPKFFNPTDWFKWTSPDILLPTAILTSVALISVHVYRSYLRRIPGAASISVSYFRKRSLFGKVTSVGDGDGFRLFHTPGGRLTGWGWMPWRKIPEGRALKDRTVCIHFPLQIPPWRHLDREVHREGGRG